MTGTILENIYGILTAKECAFQCQMNLGIFVLSVFISFLNIDYISAPKCIMKQAASCSHQPKPT